MDKRILGVIIGLSILASIFIIPFMYRGARPLTLFDTTQNMIAFLGDVQSLTPQYLPLNITFILVFVLLVIAGLFGVLPIVSGVASVLGMSSLSLATYVYSQVPLWGMGYYLLWALSIGALGNYLWLSRIAYLRKEELSAHKHYQFN
jgi:hypothetical protein